MSLAREQASMLLMREVLCEQVYRRISHVRAEMETGYATVAGGAPRFDLNQLHKLLTHPCNELALREIKPGDLEPYAHVSVLEMGKEALRSYASEVLTKIEAGVVPPRVTFNGNPTDLDRGVDVADAAIIFRPGVPGVMDIQALFPAGTKLTDFRPQPGTTRADAPLHVVMMLSVLDALVSPGRDARGDEDDDGA